MKRLPSKKELYRKLFNLLEEIEQRASYDDSLQWEIDGALSDIDKVTCLYYAIPTVYVAGAYYPNTKEFGESSGLRHWDITQNIYAARMVGAEAVKKGWIPTIPHTNTAWMSGLQPHKWWYRATLEQLRVCDAIVMVPGWEQSTGATEELEEARRMGIPIYMNVNELPRAVLINEDE